MKEIIDFEVGEVNPVSLRSEKLVEMAHLQKEIDDLEEEQRKRRFPSEKIRERIKFLYSEMEDLETELAHVEEEITPEDEKKREAMALNVKLSDLKPQKKTPKCPQCGNENSESKIHNIKVTATGTTRLRTLKGVPYYLCPDCGEDWASVEQAKVFNEKLGKILNKEKVEDNKKKKMSKTLKATKTTKGKKRK